MPIKTRIDSTSGPVSTNNDTGFTVERNTANRGFAPFPVDGVPTVSTNTTLTAGDGGVTILSSTVGLTGTLPTAASCPGAQFIFRVGSAQAHLLTSSQETAGTSVIVSGSAVGQRLTLGAVVNNSIILKSTGTHFVVIGNFGATVLA